MSNLTENLKLSDFNYNLPEELIAQRPTMPRDHCRLLALSKKTGEMQHKKFFNIVDFLQKGDVLVFNNSKVIPARIFGKKAKPRTENSGEFSGAWDTGGSVEILLIKKVSANQWEALLKNFKLKELGKKIIVAKNFTATPQKNIDGGLWLIKFNCKGDQLKKLIYKYGQTPLPPYIKKSAKLSDYQTIYAKKEGSAAAPTAGLHFTKDLLNSLKKKGVQMETITLHVGLGTFAPIKDGDIEHHKMHSEWASISKKTADVINKAKSEGRRVIAVGTTSTRTLEAFSKESRIKSARLDRSGGNQESRNSITAGKKKIDIFIKPGYEFKIVDGMITNFHLPRTTLMILVSAFARRDPSINSGREKILKAYNEAIKKKYKFFSFGDAMLII